jgi:CBS domain-containing protein
MLVNEPAKLPRIRDFPLHRNDPGCPMLKVRDIMTTDVVSVSPKTSLRDAIELFTANHVSGAPVIDGAEVVGVISASDVLAFESTIPSMSSERDDGAWTPRAEDEPEPDGLEDEDERGAEFFEDEWDDAGGEVTARLAGAESSEWDFLAEHDVAEVMTRKLVAIAPDAPAEEAARLMNECGIHRVFVIDARRVIGVVSAIDIARAVAEHQLETRTYVFNRDRDFENPTA